MYCYYLLSSLLSLLLVLVQSYPVTVLLLLTIFVIVFVLVIINHTVPGLVVTVISTIIPFCYSITGIDNDTIGTNYLYGGFLYNN